MEHEPETQLLKDWTRAAETRGFLILGVGNTLLTDEASAFTSYQTSPATSQIVMT